MGLASIPLAVAGLRQLWRERSTRYIVVAVAMLVAYVVAYVPGRPYYTDGMLPVVFAAGAVAVEGRRRLRPRGRWFVSPIAAAVISLVLVLPVLPEAAWSGNSAIHKLNYDMTETIGWPQLTRAVAAVVHRLPAAERRDASVFTANYGEASALLVLAPPGGLPPVLSGHNTFSLWGPGSDPDTTVVSVGASSSLRPYFASCRAAAIFRSPDDVINDENGTVISVCTGPRGPWRIFWRALRHFD